MDHLQHVENIREDAVCLERGLPACCFAEVSGERTVRPEVLYKRIKRGPGKGLSYVVYLVTCARHEVII